MTVVSNPPEGGGGGGEVQKAEKWIGKHKVAALGGGGLLAFLLLSRRGSGTITAADPSAGTGPLSPAAPDTEGQVGGPDLPVAPDAPIPPDAPVPPDAPSPPDAPPPAEPLAPIEPGPVAPTPSQPTQPPRKGVPRPGTHAPPPSQPTPKPKEKGYFSTLQAYTRADGSVYTWHHYTSGTRKGDKVRVEFVGKTTPRIVPPARDGWHPATLNMGDYERHTGTTQYE